MHIVIDARYLNAPGSGIATYAANLLRQLLLADSENRYGLVTREPGLALGFDSERCYDILFDYPPRSHSTVKLLGKLMNRRSFDVYHSPYNLLPAGLRRPSVVTVHDTIPLLNASLVDKRRVYRWSAGRFWKNGLKKAVREATMVVTISETSAEDIAAHFGDEVRERTVVTGSGVDPVFLEKDESVAKIVEKLLGGTFPFVLLVGQGSPRKNHVRALYAFDRAFSRDDEMRFVLVRRMKRKDRHFERVVQEPSIRDRLDLLDHVDTHELRALYRQARVFFFPSLVEGFGLPIIEAMASGCPVVTSDRGAMAEVAGEAAWLTDPRDVDAMAAALRQAATDEDARERKIEEGVRRASEFDFETCARRTLDVYRRLIP